MPILSTHLLHTADYTIGGFTDDKAFACVNLSRLFMSEKYVPCNFINIKHMKYEKAAPENVS